MALGGSSRLHTTTLLEQLLEEINFQRTKEMRQLMKDESGFVVLQGTTYWTDLFVRHFLFQEEQSIDCDDLLFFVRKRHVKGSSRYLPKYETDVEVFRKDSKKLPIGDPEIDWEETVYLNLIVHQFDYTLTLAICTRTSPKELQVLKRHSQKVYASPSRRKMDTKGEGEEMTYPHICFMVDNFDEVFCDIVVRDGEMVCVELVARGRGGGTQAVIFLGSIRYDALTRVYDSRQSSLSTKVAARMSFGLLGASAAARCEFVRMKGPCGKGHAEMAVSKPRGSGIETPSSEPGLCNTDMWDSDWEDDAEEMFVYRHQRRLSDPSANINNFVRGGWRTRDKSDKSRSENEGLDSMVSGIAEVEAGDVRDAGAASSPAMRGLLAPRPAPRSPACLSRRAPVAPRLSPARRAPPPLAPFTLNQPREKPPTQSKNLTNTRDKTPKQSQNLPNTGENPPKEKNLECEIADDAASLDESDIVNASPVRVIRSSESRETVRGIEEVPDWEPESNFNRKCLDVENDRNVRNEWNSKRIVGSKDSLKNWSVKSERNSKSNHITSWRDSFKSRNVKNVQHPKSNLSDHKNSLKDRNAENVRNFKNNDLTDPKNSLRDRNSKNDRDSKNNDLTDRNDSLKNRKDSLQDPKDPLTNPKDPIKDRNGNNENTGPGSEADRRWAGARGYVTLPRRRSAAAAVYRRAPVPPRRTTPDGTHIYYWCDLPRKHELDDGAYNPLWAMRGFTQTFHLWKEGRRAQCTPLHAYLTYVTLPWWSIAKDILDHREEPILTF